MAEVAAVISLVATYGKYSVRLLLFTDTIECFIFPRKGVIIMLYTLCNAFVNFSRETKQRASMLYSKNLYSCTEKHLVY